MLDKRRKYIKNCIKDMKNNSTIELSYNNKTIQVKRIEDNKYFLCEENLLTELLEWEGYYTKHNIINMIMNILINGGDNKCMK